MITISTQISGGQIGSELKSDPEELAYALVEIASGFTIRDANAVAEILGSDDAAEVLEMLKTLATAITATLPSIAA